MSNGNLPSSNLGRLAFGLALTATTWVVGCSDDGGGDGNDGGSSGKGGLASGGTAGKGGKGGSSSGGSSSGGTAGKGGEAGDPGAGGAAGSGEGGDGGAGPEPFEPITKLTHSLISGVNDLRGLVYSADGTKIYGSGHTSSLDGDRQLAVVRFNADGTLDDTFDSDGVWSTNLAVADVANGHPGNEESLGIVELAGGDILIQAQISDGNGGGEMIEDDGIDDGTLQDPAADDVARPDGQDIVLIRLSSAGGYVEGFGTAGIQKLDFGWAAADDASWPAPTYNSTLQENQRFSGPGFPTDTSWGLALDKSGATEKVVVFGFGPSGKVAAGTQRTDNDRYVARLIAETGALDPEFNGGSVATFFMPGTFGDNARRGIVEADGSIVSGGYANLGTGWGNHVVLVRLKPDGTPDTTFGFGNGPLGGAVSNPFRLDGGAAECYAVGKQSNGRYVTAGYGNATATGQMSSYGYASTTGPDALFFGFRQNELDLEFGIDGTMAIQSELAGQTSSEDRGRDLTVLADDRIVAAGRFGTRPALFVLNPDGTLATELGTSGRFEYDPLVDPSPEPVNTSHFYKLAVSPDGTRIAATTNNHPSGVLLALLKVGE